MFFPRILLLLVLLPFLHGCGKSSQNEESTQGSRVDFDVLAGSELKDLEPLLPEIKRATGIGLKLRYQGTLEGAESLMAGDPADLAWFSHAKYLELLEGMKNRIVAREKIMLSPVSLGVKESLARRWGWYGNPEVSWRDIAAKAASGELRYAMTNPASSNSGFNALIGVAVALSGKGEALMPEDIDARRLADFFRGQALTAGSSGWLAEAYVKEQPRLDGLVNYESVLLELNAGGKLQEPLYPVYPREGVITADYPLILLQAGKREAYRKLVEYLRSPGFQRLMMETTHRRPVIPQVKPGPEFSDRLLVELPFPNSQKTVDELLFAYLDRLRRPAHVFFVLDLSGSMAGSRILKLRESLANLTGLDRSLSGKFARFRQREEVTLIPFDQEVRPEAHFVIADAGEQGKAMQAIRDYAERLHPGGATALYEGLKRAYALAQKARRRAPDAVYSIVLMSDGESNSGMGAQAFQEFHRSLDEETRRIRTFTILFGEANVQEMQGIADLTDGRWFDARKSLTQAFKTIRGYQ